MRPTAEVLPATIYPTAVTNSDGAFVGVASVQPLYSEIMWLASEGISMGWVLPDGTVEYRPAARITRDAMAAFMYRLAGSPEFTAPPVSPFVDVPLSQPFYKEITWLAEEGISMGWVLPDGSAEYRPVNQITRDAMAAFMYRLSGSPAVFLHPVVDDLAYFEDDYGSSYVYGYLANPTDNTLSVSVSIDVYSTSGSVISADSGPYSVVVQPHDRELFVSYADNYSQIPVGRLNWDVTTGDVLNADFFAGDVQFFNLSTYTSWGTTTLTGEFVSTYSGDDGWLNIGAVCRDPWGEVSAVGADYAFPVESGKITAFDMYVDAVNSVTSCEVGGLMDSY